MIRDQQPARIVEIGCGHSTRVMARAAIDGGLVVDHTCIDPSPRAHLAGLAVRHLSETVDQVDPAIFATVAAGDVLFVDSSHIAMPGSDVDLVINNVLPRLSSGSIVHFHDIFLPFAYPAHWQWRGYNEQLLVAALLSSGSYEILFSSAYVTRRMIDLLRHSVIPTLALPEGAFESSLWLRKRRAP
jgi:hypothetical protein